MLLKKVFMMTLLLLFYCTSQAISGQITDDLRVIIDKTISILKDPAYVGTDKKKERNSIINKIVSEKFDWEEMAKRTLGFHWREITKAQQKDFVAIFNDFLERTYIAKVDLFLKESNNFTSKNISYETEIIEGKYALVKSNITINEEVIPLNYKLLHKGNTWIVYDLTIEGVGLVANYRTQFNEILASASFNELIDKLKSKEGTEIVDKKEEQKK